MAFLGMDSDKQKINFIRSCGGPDLTEFWENEAHMSCTNNPADPGRGTAAQVAFLCMQENKHYRCCNGVALSQCQCFAGLIDLSSCFFSLTHSGLVDLHHTDVTKALAISRRFGCRL